MTRGHICREVGVWTRGSGDIRAFNQADGRAEREKCLSQKVCIQPRSSAVDIALPEFAAEQFAVACCRSMSPVREALSSKPAACRCLSTRQADGRKDAQPFHRSCSIILYFLAVFVYPGSAGWQRFCDSYIPANSSGLGLRPTCRLNTTGKFCRTVEALSLPSKWHPLAFRY